MCLLTTRIIRKFGFIILIATSYGCFCLFLSAHLYPSIYLLLPGYVIFGLTLGPAWVSKLTLLVSLASRMSCSQPECGGSSYAGINADSFDEHKLLCNREETIRRLSRWYHAAQDFGIIIGAVIASFVLTCASSSRAGCLYTNYSQQISALSPLVTDQPAGDSTTQRSIVQQIISFSENNSSTLANFTLVDTNAAHVPTIDVGAVGLTSDQSLASLENRIQPATYHSRRLNQVEHQFEKQHGVAINQKNESRPINAGGGTPTTERFLYNMFEINDHGERICGSHLCPVWKLIHTDRPFNTSFTAPIKYSGATPLVCVYLVMSVIAVTVTALASDVDNLSHNIKFDAEHVKGMTDTLMFAGPLALFTGVEHGYLLADFTKVSGA
jgi:hypothetical protein